MLSVSDRGTEEWRDGQREGQPAEGRNNRDKNNRAIGV